MKSFKGLFKYLVFFVIASWMFVLGIIVGRGSAPVTFDTTKFQTRLESIAENFASQKKTPEKLELKFYDVLDKPDIEETALSNKNKSNKNNKNQSSESIGEIIPKKTIIPLESILVKTSKKKQTYNHSKNKLAQQKKSEKKQNLENPDRDQQSHLVKISEKNKTPENNNNSVKNIDKKKSVLENKSKNRNIAIKGKYTVQIAAYKELKDAVSHIVVLKKKGLSSYSVKGLKNKEIWYRVRSGSFSNMEDAKKFKKKLEKFKINSLIIELD